MKIPQIPENLNKCKKVNNSTSFTTHKVNKLPTHDCLYLNKLSTCSQTPNVKEKHKCKKNHLQKHWIRPAVSHYFDILRHFSCLICANTVVPFETRKLLFLAVNQDFKPFKCICRISNISQTLRQVIFPANHHLP